MPLFYSKKCQNAEKHPLACWIALNVPENGSDSGRNNAGRVAATLGLFIRVFIVLFYYFIFFIYFFVDFSFYLLNVGLIYYVFVCGLFYYGKKNDISHQKTHIYYQKH
jgi:hypothetical protein